MRQIRPTANKQGCPSKKDEFHIPDAITVASGTYLTKDLLNKVRNRTSHNLLKKSPHRQKMVTRPMKYTPNERLWQSTATLEQLEEKYNITRKQAQHMRYQAKSIVEYLENSGVDCQQVDE